MAESSDPESSFTTWPVVSGGVVYASSGPGVIAVSAVDGKRLWFTQTEEGQKQVSPAIGKGVLYVPLPFGKVAALDIGTGRVLWKVTVGEGSLYDPSPTLTEDLLLFGLPEDHVLIGLNASDGSIRWKTPTELEPDSVPAVGDGRVVFSTQDADSERVLVLSVDEASGAEVWRVEQKESISSPSILDKKVIFGGGDFFAYALDLQTGKEIWKSSVEGKFDTKNMPALAFGDVFLADRIGNIYRLDGETGKRKWIFRDTIGTMDQSFPVIAGKTLFIGSGAGYLYALDTDSGRLLWKDSVEGIVLSGAADAQHFYFGVKLGKGEGLYAYGHDPKGKLESPPSRFKDLRSVFGGLILFALIFVGFILYSRRKRARAAA